MLYSRTIPHLHVDCTCKGKWCSKCVRKCVLAFNKLHSSSDGLQYTCRDCQNAAKSKFREDNKEDISKQRAQARKENPEKFRKYDRDYRKNNPDIVKRSQQTYRSSEQGKMMSKKQGRDFLANNPLYTSQKYHKNKKYHQEHHINYAANNRDKLNHSAMLYRARKLQASGNYTLEEWENLKQRYDYTCLRCGKQEPEIKLTADHIVPLIKGGTNNIDNLQPLCASCNSHKRARTVDYRTQNMEEC